MMTNMNPQLGDIQEPIVSEIAEFHHMSKEEAKAFLQRIRSWCATNVTNQKWSNEDRTAKAVTTYGLKHVCERDLDEYVANNWMKAALYLEGFQIKKVKDKSAITIGDMFENAVNFHFKD